MLESIASDSVCRHGASGRLHVFVCTFLLAAVSQVSVLAQVQLDRFYPPVVSRGKQTIVKAEGKFPAWPVKIVSDRDEIQLVAAQDSGDVQVVVGDDAAPGVVWVRMHDASSASKLVPLLIEPIEAIAESEPNNDVSEANEAILPSVLVGRLEKSGDVDTFSLSVGAGQTLVISTTAHCILGSPMDAVLQLVDRRGNVLVQSDDVRGLDPQIVYQASEDTDLWVRVFAFPETPNSTIGFAGSAAFVYALRVTTDAFVDHALPLIVTAEAAHESQFFGWNLPTALSKQQSLPSTGISPRLAHLDQSLGWQWQEDRSSGSLVLIEPNEVNERNEPPIVDALPCTFSGHLSQFGEVDRLRFHVENGKRYLAAVHSRRFGFNVDSVLRLVDVRDQSELAGNDDSARNQYDAVIEYTAKEDGEVELQISDLLDGFGPRHAYTVVIEESRPAVSLSLADEHFLVTAGETLEIPVAVSRLRGFKDPLQIVLENLPGGVQCEAIVSDSKGDSAKSVKLTLTADKAASFQGTIRIVGHPLDGDGKPGPQQFVAAHSLRENVPVMDVWLTVAPSAP